jgi:hypothetical protein
MSGDAKKISELAVANTLSSTDRVVVLVNPASSANVRTITTANFANSVAARFVSNTAPVSNTSNGSPGQIAYDATSIYVCVANNRWGRATLTLAW